MKSYTLKSIGKNSDYMTIVREMEDGFVVKIFRDMDGYEDIKTDYISKELFDSCIRTGYLTEINPQDVEKALKDIINDNYYLEDRMMLEGEIIKANGDVIEIPESLNEIAISKNIFGVVRFDAIINGKLINSYTADGILVCTPTGSTAYNLSCSGPIVDPTAEIITLTPIAPHTIINRSIIISDNSIVELKITELRRNTRCYVLYDGQEIEVFNGDTIKIRKSDKVTKIIKLEDRSFIDTIRENIS